MIQGGYPEASASFSRSKAARPGPFGPMARVKARHAQSSHATAGFTIVEVMIVLAVTSVMAISAIAFIAGRQSKTQFTTAINGLQQQLQQVINETASGFYPNNTSFSCTRSVSTPPTLTAQATGDHQGKNPDCIFLGKVIQFGVASTDPQAYQVIPIVGNRLDPSGTAEASTLYNTSGTTGSFPEAAAAGTTPGTNLGLAGADVQVQLTQGLKVVSMWYNNNTANLTSTLGIISSLPSLSGSNLASGTQQVGLYTVPTTRLNQTVPQTVDQLYPGIASAQPLVQVSSIEVCVASGSTNQSGLVRIGANDTGATGSLAVNLSIIAGLTC